MRHWGAGPDFDYGPSIKAAVSAAQAVHPEATVLFYTDDYDIDLPCLTIRLPLGKELGLNRTRTWAAHARAWHGPTLHIDSDIIIRRRFDPVFAREFDFAWSWRPPSDPFMARMPINGGMLLQKSGPDTAAFLDDMAEQIEALARINRRPGWLTAGGEQLALGLMLYGCQPGKHKTPWGTCGVFYADNGPKWKGINHTYDGTNDGQFADHYKGQRKL